MGPAAVKEDFDEKHREGEAEGEGHQGLVQFFIESKAFLVAFWGLLKVALFGGTFLGLFGTFLVPFWACFTFPLFFFFF